MHLTDFGGHLAGIARALLAATHLVEDGCEHQFGIAQDAQGTGDVEVDVGRIQRGMDDGFALRHGDAEVGLPKAAADAEDQVRFLEEVVHRTRNGETARTERQRVRLGKGALAFQAGANGNGKQLGQRLEFVPGLRPMHALAGVEHGPLRLHKHRRGLAHGLQVGTRSQARTGDVIDAVDLFGEHVDRHLDQHRGAASTFELGEGAAEDARQILGRRHRFGRLGDVAHTEARIVVPADMGEVAGIAHGHHQNRDRFAVGLGNAAIGVLATRPVLHAKDADFAPGGDARDGIGHVQPGPLLAHDDRADARGSGALQDVVDRIADHPFDLLALQDLGNGVRGLHVSSNWGLARLAHLAAALSVGPGRPPRRGSLSFWPNS